MRLTENFNPPELKKLLTDMSSILTNTATVDWSLEFQVDGCGDNIDGAPYERIQQLVETGFQNEYTFAGAITSGFCEEWTRPGENGNEEEFDDYGNPSPGPCSSDVTWQCMDPASEMYYPECAPCREACMTAVSNYMTGECDIWNLSLDYIDYQLYDDYGFNANPTNPLVYGDGESWGRCCEPLPGPHPYVAIPADDAGEISQALGQVASALSRIAAELPSRNDEDPNSSPWDVDGWLDDFAVADWEHLGSEGQLLSDSLASIDWISFRNTYDPPDDDHPDDGGVCCSGSNTGGCNDFITDGSGCGDNDALKYTSLSEEFADIAAIPHINAMPEIHSQSCPDLIPSLDGMLAASISPKRIKDIMDAYSALLTKIMRIDWSGTEQEPICTRPRDPGCGQYTDEDSCGQAIVQPDLSPCPSAFIEDGTCDEPPPPPPPPPPGYPPAPPPASVGGPGDDIESRSLR